FSPYSLVLLSTDRQTRIGNSRQQRALYRHSADRPRPGRKLVYAALFREPHDLQRQVSRSQAPSAMLLDVNNAVIDDNKRLLVGQQAGLHLRHQFHNVSRVPEPRRRRRCPIRI
ncbi:MAG: hypothetical protein WA773_08915, partial [Bradyrhizobium sp.]